MKKTKRNTQNTGKTRKITPKVDAIISNASKLIVNNQIIQREAEKVEDTLTPINMKRYAMLVTTILEDEIKTTGTYSPSINKRLASVRQGTITDIFGCGAESVLKKTRAPNTFEIRIGTDKNKQPICVPATSPHARDIFMKNLKANIKLNPANIIAPMQRYSNCWFNTMFMCFFVSDKGRKFMRFFRQFMIEGKLVNGRTIQSKSLSYAFILFNASIEACYNHGQVKNIYPLALNTNNIIMHIHKSISKTPGVEEYGNPYLYYRDIIAYLDAGNVSVTLKRYTVRREVDDFFNNTATVKETPDIIVVTLHDYTDKHKAQSNMFHKKSETVKFNSAEYKLDSVICRDKTQMHFCCGVTCNNKPYVFDGAVFSKMQKRPWKEWINKDYDWAPRGSPYIWNFMKGYSMLFYYRVS